MPDTPAFLEEISGEFEDIMLGDINPDHLIPLDDEMGDVNPFGEIFENIGHLKFFKLLFRGPSDESVSIDFISTIKISDNVFCYRCMRLL